MKLRVSYSSSPITAQQNCHRQSFIVNLVRDHRSIMHMHERPRFVNVADIDDQSLVLLPCTHKCRNLKSLKFSRWWIFYTTSQSFINILRLLHYQRRFCIRERKNVLLRSITTTKERNEWYWDHGWESNTSALSLILYGAKKLTRQNYISSTCSRIFTCLQANT